jgi:hypothetical protein
MTKDELNKIWPSTDDILKSLPTMTFRLGFKFGVNWIYEYLLSKCDQTSESDTSRF